MLFHPALWEYHVICETTFIWVIICIRGRSRETRLRRVLDHNFEKTFRKKDKFYKFFVPIKIVIYFFFFVIFPQKIYNFLVKYESGVGVVHGPYSLPRHAASSFALVVVK